ncbi:hypothetical protein Mapa_013662 [Marchantia paleacea]|nr:hypothetical protein Mapa_013662 [Marchantia paleacea]
MISIDMIPSTYSEASINALYRHSSKVIHKINIRQYNISTGTLKKRISLSSQIRHHMKIIFGFVGMSRYPNAPTIRLRLLSSDLGQNSRSNWSKILISHH